MVVVCEQQEKEVPAGQPKPRDVTGVSAVTTSRLVTWLGQGCIARVASLLLARLSLEKLSISEPNYICIQIDLNIPYSNRE